MQVIVSYSHDTTHNNYKLVDAGGVQADTDRVVTGAEENEGD